MRLLVISDLEDRELPIEILLESHDLIISCGDVYNRTYDLLPPRIEVPLWAVHGNHDDADWPRPVWNLHRQTRQHGDVLFGGFEGAWRYKPGGRFLYDEYEVEQALAHFPPVDVFVAHNPPAGIHDCDDGVHNGFRAFRTYIQRCQPRYFLHGHVGRAAETECGSTRVICTHGWRFLELDA